MPDVNYESEYELKRSKNNQQELEKLKKEVYLEGLQVEEEGLTDVLRKKIKQAITIENNDSHRTNEKVLNEAVVSSLHFSSFSSALMIFYTIFSPFPSVCNRNRRVAKQRNPQSLTKFTIKYTHHHHLWILNLSRKLMQQ